MYQLLESIYLNDGEFRNLGYHEARMRESVNVLFNQSRSFDLFHELTQQSLPAEGLYKTRVIYNTAILKIEFVPYVSKSVKSLKLIEANDISYPHKFIDRSRLTELYSQRGTAEDILIVKNGLITDTYYGNIIFKKKGLWYTPASYLLKGTMRQSLLDAGLIKEALIDQTNYTHFESCKIINAMLGIDASEIMVTDID